MLAFCTWDNSSIGLNPLYQDADSQCQSHCLYRKPLGFMQEQLQTLIKYLKHKQIEILTININNANFC